MTMLLKWMEANLVQIAEMAMDWWENLQESPVVNGKSHDFL